MTPNETVVSLYLFGLLLVAGGLGAAVGSAAVTAITLGAGVIILSVCMIA